MGVSAHKRATRSSKTKPRTSRAFLAETSSNQQRILFQLSVNAEQVTGANDGLVVDIPAVPISLVYDDEVPVTKMIPQTATRSRSKRRVVNVVSPQSEGVKKPKDEGQNERFVNLISQQLGTARSQFRKAQSRRDKNSNSRKRNVTQVFVMHHPNSTDKHPKDKEGAAASGAADTNIQSFFKAKRHRPETQFQDSNEQGQQGSPERKQRSAVSSTSNTSHNCAHHVFSYVTANFIVPGVQHVAATETNSSTYVECFASSPLP